MAASKNTKNVTRAASASAVNVVTLTALVPIDYDGLRVSPGDTFDVRGDDVPQLMAVEAARLADTPEGEGALP